MPDTFNVSTGAEDPNVKEEKPLNQIDDDGKSDYLRSTAYDSVHPLLLDDYVNKGVTGTEVRNGAGYFDYAMHSSGLHRSVEIDLFDNYYRFGVLAPDKTLHTVKEYIFFTKPDLNIYPRQSKSQIDNATKYAGGNVKAASEASLYLPQPELNPALSVLPYWVDLAKNNPRVIQMLQDSLATEGNHFNFLLGNAVQNNLSIPSLTSEMIDTPNNTYGVGFQYRGSSESSDDNFDFTLEFKDTKKLDVYHFFKAYEEYQTLKHHGVVRPWINYITNKILHDQYSIFKFLVDEDGETIIYYAQYYGVKSKSLPRDVFESTSYDNGLSFSVDFNAAFFEDMNPNIIRNFNEIAGHNSSTCNYCDSLPYRIDVFNEVMDGPDARAVQSAYIDIVKVPDPEAAGSERRVYKLRWKGSDRV